MDGNPTSICGNPQTAVERIPQFLSIVFSPLLVPTYGIAMALWTSLLVFLPMSMKLSVVGVTFFITCVIPASAIFAMWRNKVITDPGLNNRRERTIPYAVTGICYMVCAYYLYRVNAPVWIWTFPAGGAIAVGIATAINIKWKISAHMAGMGGFIAVAFRIAADGVNAVQMNVWLTVVVVLAGLVGTARVILHRHTVAQVFAGTALGFLSVYLLSSI